MITSIYNFMKFSMIIKVSVRFISSSDGWNENVSGY